MKTIKKILIANRGEIAIRVMRTAADMGIKTVAVFSDADAQALFVSKADEAVCIGGAYAADSYLNQDKIIAAAKLTGADAIHPGYGFLSENSSFSKRCKDEGIVFIGPAAEVIEVMGSKISAKEIMKKAGVPVVPGYNGADQTPARFKQEAEKIGFPVLLKASAGGGGKGMRIVHAASELDAAVEGASREANKSFGDGTLLMEKYFSSAKHIEFQIFGDTHGNYTHFFERECSLQRRYQKVIEESPSPSLNAELRKKMGGASVAAASSIKYTNAGTVEFILDKEGNFYFLEVNTRLQVEHPVTEETTGLDLVQLQIEVAQGMPLKVSSENIKQHGHSIQCRVCAEDPENNFFPATGDILYWSEPHLKGLRYDSGVKTGSKIEVYYDSLIAKVISYGNNRTEAKSRMYLALDKMSILGITSNKDFLKELLQNPSFVDGSFDTKLIEREYSNYKNIPTAGALHEMAIAALLYNWNGRRESETFPPSLNGWRNIFYQHQLYTLELAGEKIQVAYRHLGNQKFEIKIGEQQLSAQLITIEGPEISCLIGSQRKTYFIAINNVGAFIHHPEQGTYRFTEVPRFVEPGAALAKGGYISPMPGEIVKVLVKPGDLVKSGKGLLVISSMKMETTIEAHSDGEVEEVFVAEKNFVEANTVLLKMKN
jgi:acetyl-CoA carboxylase biotin carboxylase subunit